MAHRVYQIPSAPSSGVIRARWRSQAMPLEPAIAVSLVSHEDIPMTPAYREAQAIRRKLCEARELDAQLRQSPSEPELRQRLDALVVELRDYMARMRRVEYLKTAPRLP
jgi:hypothetical protein